MFSKFLYPYKAAEMHNFLYVFKLYLGEVFDPYISPYKNK